jgi:hypothetical protein
MKTRFLKVQQINRFYKIESENIQSIPDPIKHFKLYRALQIN